MNRERRRDDLRKARLAFYFALFFSAVAIGFFVPEDPLTLRYCRTVLNAVFWVCIAYAVLFLGFSGVELFRYARKRRAHPSRRPAKSD